MDYHWNWYTNSSWFDRTALEQFKLANPEEYETTTLPTTTLLPLRSKRLSRKHDRKNTKSNQQGGKEESVDGVPRRQRGKRNCTCKKHRKNKVSFKLKKYYQNVTLSVLCKSKSVHRDCGCRVDFIHFYFHECWNMVLHMLIGASLKGEEINCVYLWTSSKLIAPERNELNQILRIKRIQERYINHFVNLLRIIHVLLSIFYVIEKHCVFHSWFQSRKVLTTDYEISYDFSYFHPLYAT